jgi:quercetin dioxygenase-like cupin family protein|tara:strand:- start:177 stop:653 length:477 start_codon:yes stop_codon:yes gene_type:complete
MRALLYGTAALLLCVTAWSIKQGFAHGADTKLQITGDGTDLLTFEGAEIKMLVDQSVLPEGEVEIGILYLPVGYDSSGEHQHGSTEVFYVMEGRLIHRLNGEVHILEPGTIGIVRKGDEIDHGVDGDVPVKALVVWVPGGEVDRLIDIGFESTPLDKD